MKETIINYSTSLKTLRTFVSSLDSVLLDKKDKYFNENELYFNILLLTAYNQHPEKFPLDENLQKKIRRTINNYRRRKKHTIILSQKEFEKILEEVMIQTEQISLLYQSSLISLVTFFELLISNILKEFLLLNPGKIENKEKTLTLEEIKIIGSFEEAEKYIIDKIVIKLMYGSFESWFNYLKGTNVGLSMDYVNEVKNEIIEIFQRRNLFVHNGGKINSIYISSVALEHRENLKINQHIEITKKYLDESIELFERIGLIISFEMWKKINPDSQERSSIILDLAFKYMESENWLTAKSLYYFLMNDKVQPEADRLVAKMNYWQCHKWLGELDKIKVDLNKEDFTARSRTFQLCAFALKDDYDRFFELLEIAYPHDISLESLKTWPIFKEVRLHDKYHDFIAKQEHSIDQTEENKKFFNKLLRSLKAN